MMGQQQTTKVMMMMRTLLVLAAMLAALVAASGAAFAVSKVCPPGTTQQNPCSGTTGIDTLVGTSGPDYVRGLAGNDKISGGAGDDTTDGGGGNDTYSYRTQWGVDTLIDSGGSADHLNLSAVGGPGLDVNMLQEFGNNNVYGANTGTEYISLSASTVIEKITGSSGSDDIFTGGAANTLRPGPGTGGAIIHDLGGRPASGSSPAIPASNDTYTGFSASGYGGVSVQDYGGTADKLVLPFDSTDAYFEAKNNDSDPAVDGLMIATSYTDAVFIHGQLDPFYDQKGHIEQIQFTDETITIGGETPQAQTISGAKTTDSAEAQVAELNEASDLDETEKEKRKKAAGKAIEEAKQKGQQPHDGEQQR